MQLLGAWMMKTPLARAAATVRFIAGASSPTRRVAPWHQCWFHMSQMMIAVCAGSHSRTFSVTTNEPAAPALSWLSHPGVQDERLLSLLYMPLLGLGRPRQSEAANPYRESSTAAPEFGHQGKPPFPIEPPRVSDPSCLVHA